MEQLCQNCGAELLPGQRFCRKCGLATGQEDNIPTQTMPPGPGQPTSGFRPPSTGPSGRSETSPVYTPPGSYQPTVPPYPMQYQPYPAEKRRSPLKWILGFVGVGLLGLIFLFAVIFINLRDDRPRRGGPPPPPPPGDRRGGEAATRTFPLAANAQVSINNFNGNVNIEGWDQPQAEVRMTVSGGRGNADGVTFQNEGGNLSIKAEPGRLGGGKVDFAIKLPRKLAQLAVEGMNSNVELSDLEGGVNVTTVNGSIRLADVIGNVNAKTVNGRVSLTDIRGDITANTTNGSLELSSVSGSAITKAVNGSTRVSFENITPGKPLEFESFSGTIDLELPADINADLEASTTTGSIQLDEGLGLEVRKKIPGESASGQIGSGGQPLTVKTVSGTIRVNRQ